MDTTWTLWHADTRETETITYLDGIKRYGEREWRKIIAGRNDNIFASRA